MSLDHICLISTPGPGWSKLQGEELRGLWSHMNTMHNNVNLEEGSFVPLMYCQNGDLTSLLKSARKWIVSCPSRLPLLMGLPLVKGVFCCKMQGCPCVPRSLEVWNLATQTWSPPPQIKLWRHPSSHIHIITCSSLLLDQYLELHNALCSYPLVKMEIGDSSQISTTAPIFSQYDYFRQTIWRLASVQFHFWYIFGD